MGMTLDYETGKKVVGHWVRWRGRKGHGSSWVPSRLVEAHEGYAVVHPTNHNHTERAQWADVKYSLKLNQIRRSG